MGMHPALLEVYKKAPNGSKAWDFPSPSKIQYRFESTD
jgi:hypothetical protein